MLNDISDEDKSDESDDIGGNYVGTTKPEAPNFKKPKESLPEELGILDNAVILPSELFKD